MRHRFLLDSSVAFGKRSLRPVVRRGHVILVFICIAFLAGCPQSDSLAEIRTLQQDNDHAATIEPLRELLRDRPKDPEVNYLYGRALVATQRPELALYSLRQSMEDPDWFVRAAFQLAYAALATNDFNEVVDAMEQILETDPGNIDALLLRAQANAHWKKDSASALEDAQTVLETDPNRIEAYEPMILALLALDQIEQANEALATAGRRLTETGATEDVRAWHCATTAVFASNTSGVEAQEDLWNECLVQFPLQPIVVDAAIQFFESLGKFDRSLEISRAANRAAPDSRKYRGTLAGRLLFAGQIDEAERLLIEATESSDPDSSSAAWTDLGELYHSGGRLAEAAEAFGRADALTIPALPDLTFRYADALILAGDLQSAEAQLDRLSVEAHQRLIRARIAQERGQNEKALVEFGEAARLWPDNPWARYYAARSAEALGRWDRALEEYRYSIRINAGATDARTRAARLLAAQGHHLPAYHTLFISVDEFPLDREGLILGAYLIARVSNASQLQDALQKHVAMDPASYSTALIRAAEGLADNGLSASAKNLLDGAPGIDFSRGAHADVLQAFVRFAYQAGNSDAAERTVAAALASAPEAAGYHVAQGLQLELGGAPLDEVRSAYLRATEFDPRNEDALESLGRISHRQERYDEAIRWFAKALATNPEGLGATLGAVRALKALGREEEAAQRLDAIIILDPYSLEATALRVDIDIDRKDITSKTLGLAERSVRLGRSARDYDRLSTVLSHLGYPDRAKQAADAARQLRDPEVSRRATQRPNGIELARDGPLSEPQDDAVDC